MQSFKLKFYFRVMISLLIPIYNWNAVPLVKSLQNQAENLNIDYEIICIDDLSTKKWKSKNEELLHYFNVNYIEVSEKLGRARIRNWLVKLSRYDNLLFLDCDSKIISKTFLFKYINELDHHQVIYGGRKYSSKVPRSKKKRLHWTYGSKVEFQVAKKRNLKPYQSFMSNNFLVKKEIIEAFPFDESIEGYGYEDLAFAHLLQNNGVSVYHIENPTLHLGIEYTEQFLKKTNHAILNLIQLEESKKITSTRLINTYKKLSRVKLVGLIESMLSWGNNKIEKNLFSSTPSMFLFSIWKLKLFIEHKNRKTSVGGLS